MYSIEDIIYKNQQKLYLNSNCLNNMILSFTKLIENLYSVPENINKIQEVSNILNSTIVNNENKNEQIDSFLNESKPIITFKNVILEWQQHLFERTQKSYEDDDYFSPTTLESYNRNLWSYVFPYLERHPEHDNINIFSESNVNEILEMTSCKDTQRVLLLLLKSTFEYAIKNSYIENNPIANKQIKNKSKNDYEFIEEEERALWD